MFRFEKMVYKYQLAKKIKKYGVKDWLKNDHRSKMAVLNFQPDDIENLWCEAVTASKEI